MSISRVFSYVSTHRRVIGVRVYRQAQVDEDGRDDDDSSSRYPVKNDPRDVTRDVTRDDVDRASAVDHRGDATSTNKPRRPATDKADAVPPSATSNHTAGCQVLPSTPSSSRPVPISRAPDQSSSRRAGCSRPVTRSPDAADKQRCRVDRCRPESSPSSRRLTSCDRVVSIGGVGTTADGRPPAVTRAHTTATGEYLLQVPDVYPPRTAPVPPSVSDVDEPPLSSSLPERGPSSPASSPRPPSPFARTRHAPRVYYSNSQDRVSASDAETRAIVPSLPYSPCASPAGLRRQPTIETRRLSVTETDEGWTQLNQYKLKDEIGKVTGSVFSAR